MCGLNTYDKKYDKSTDATNFGGGRSLSENSTIDSIVSIYIIINFMETWINALANNVLCRYCEYQEKMKEFFNQITTEK